MKTQIWTSAFVCLLLALTPFQLFAYSSSMIDGTWQLSETSRANKTCPPSVVLSTDVRIAKTEAAPNGAVDPEAGRYTVRTPSSKWSGSTLASQYPDGESKEVALVTFSAISSQKAWNNCAKGTSKNCSGSQDFSVHSSDGQVLAFKLQRKALNVSAQSIECEYKK